MVGIGVKRYIYTYSVSKTNYVKAYNNDKVIIKLRNGQELQV